MKNFKIFLAFCISLIWYETQAQNTEEKHARSELNDLNELNSLSKNFSNPTIPGTLIIESYEGDIQIVGYPGREVLIEARLTSGSQKPSGFSLEYERPFTWEEKNNTMTIRTKTSFYGLTPRIDYKLKVPEKTTIKVKILKAGNLEMSNTSRLVEVDNQNGSVKLDELQGWAIVNTVNGDIRANFTQVIDNKAMSFISLNGGIYLELPKDTRADFKMKSTTGTIQNEFAPPLPQQEQILLNENNLKGIDQGANFNRPEEIVLIAKDEKQKEKADEVTANQKTVQKKESERKNNKQSLSVNKPTEVNEEAPKTTIHSEQDKTQKTYLAPMSFESQANGGGPVFFISARNGEIKVNKSKKK